MIAPDGAQSTAVVTPGQTVLDDFANGNRAFIDSERLSRLNGDARIYIEVSSGAATRVEPGMWQTPATTRRGIAIANYNHVLMAPAASSSRGRTRDGRDKPELAAPGTNIVASGALGGRPAPGGQLLPVRVRKSGTSMSAPHVAGIVALLLQRRPDLSASQMRGALLASATPPANVQPFDIAWGYGRIDAQRALGVVDQVP